MLRVRPHQSVVLAAIYHDAGWYKYEAQPVYDIATRSTPNFVQVPPIRFNSKPINGRSTG